MTALDDIVFDPRFAPYRGWHDDYRNAVGGDYRAAMMQVRSEFHAFAELLTVRGIQGRCLQLGLGHGVSHMVFKHLYNDVVSVDYDQTVVNNLVNAVGPVETLIVGDTHSHGTLEKVRALGQFDLLFIDADHRIDDVSADFHDYSPLVRYGGMIALHDALPPQDDNGVWRFLSTLRSSGYEMSVIGSELGIACITQNGVYE